MRHFFRAITIAIVTLFCLSGCQSDTRAKYIFLFIGDGMGASHVAVTESYLSYKEGKLGGEQLLMTQFPYYGMATTHSANRNVTCSSAAGTAIACGVKTNNGTVGVDKDSVRVESIATMLKEEGYKVGLLTTVPINHATPAAFYAHSVKRTDYYGISCDIPASGFDFFAGTGFLQFTGKDNDKESTEEFLERNGYTVSYGIEEFRKESVGKDKVVFCQAKNRGKSAGYYVSDGLENTGVESEEPGADMTDATMPEMLELALEYLGDDKPFFIMGEGGIIDWASHENRTMSTVENVLDFDAAIKVAYEFYKKHPKETLIIVTADHETGGLTLGAGRATINWKALEEQWIESGKKNILDAEANAELNKKCSIGWTTVKHAGGAVPVYAIGVGAEKFNGQIDNTEIMGKILGGNKE
ncbi:MAG: alkaline phosphatase [Bacteroidales bacterium]|nr:alkaline phosphatase [Bacteroidales bacterium]